LEPRDPPGQVAGTLVGCMEWTRRTVETTSGPRQVLVGAPLEDAVISAETLIELRSERLTGLPHERVMETVSALREPVHAVVLRGRATDGSGQFRLARELDDPELEEVGYLLARAQLRAWRPLLLEGVLAIARVELRVWELAALRSGATRLAEELAADKQNAADAWLLQHTVLNFGVGLDTALSELLPARLHEIEATRRTGRVA
jgi:hypothetical protein